MSYCRITGKSRGLPKPNYFPLLAPISPADARRYCRITGKAYGLPSHHYIPVILTTFSNKSKCKITNSTDFGPHHYAPDINYGNRKHIVLADYRYMFPTFDESDDLHRDLLELLNSKVVTCDSQNFVYPVAERKCSLIFSAKLEAAVRDGDVHDVMLAKTNDSVLLKMKKGKSVSLDLQEYDSEMENHLYDGEGPREDVLLERELEERDKKQKTFKRKESMLHMAKIFEGKERDHDEQLIKNIAQKEAKRQKMRAKLADRSRKINFSEFSLDSTRANTNLHMEIGDWRDLVKPVIESWDWDTYEKEASRPDCKPIASTMPAPCDIKADILSPKIIKIDETVLQNNTGFDVVPCIVPLTPFTEKPQPELIEAIKNMDKEIVEQLANVNEKILEDNELFQTIPTPEDINDVLNNFSNGTLKTINKLPGLSLDIGAAKSLFLTGHVVSTPTGEVFVPGQSVNTPNGIAFLPGLTVSTPNGPSFIPGSVIPNPRDPRTPVFVAGQIVDDEFIFGQTVYTNNGPRFIEGQTVITPDGLKFVAGVVDEKTNRFVPGQTLITPDGPTFIPGQTITTKDGEQFIAGQSSFNDKEGWTFTPGQIINEKFIAGKSVITNEGSKFVPGQYVDDNFIPGITTDTTQGLEFVPGLNVETKQGPKFVEGQIVQSAHGEIFMPGKSIVSDTGMINFAVAKTISEINFTEPLSNGFVIDSTNIDITTQSLSVYGHMVQTKKGIEFYPGKIDIANLPEGKIIPGKLIRQDTDTKFVPGIMENGGFIPGQVVWTEKGEQFIPGQVIETAEGLKFVPGQVIETKNSGGKFVPGQTVETSEGPRFIPGQIVHTKAGPTFIPGQVIYTEDEGERFVPGQVVDTEDGPRFVPGKVLESGDKVTFIPGQIVQTDQGPRYVAPDLSDDEDGEQKYSVQSFLVTPEELTLLKPSHTWTTSPHSKGELSIDAKMLRQLSEAGMTIGRQIETSAVDIVLQSTKNIQTVKKLAEKLSIAGNEKTEVLENLFVKIKGMINVIQQKTENGIIVTSQATNGFSNGCNGSGLKTEEELAQHLINILSSTILSCVISTANTKNVSATATNKIKNHNNSSLYELISQTLEEKLGHFFGEGNNSETTIDIAAIERLLASPKSMQTLEHKVNDLVDKTIKISKVDLITSTISKNIYNESEIINNFCVVLEQDEDMIEAVRNLSHSEPKLLYRIISNMKADIDKLEDDATTIATLKRSVIAAVKASADNEIQQLFTSGSSSVTANQTNEKLNVILMETIALAKALGLTDISASLNLVLGHTETAKKLLQDENIMELVHRVVVMRKLSTNDPTLQQSLAKLSSDPFSARKDPKMRELLRRSGVCTISPLDKTKLTDSNEVPISLFCSDNQLAMEDFLMRRETKARGAFLIVKEGLQAVVPRESSRDVLTGKCAYTVLDENGIRHFEPLHVFSALKLNFPASHRFSIYSCDVAGDNEDIEVESVFASSTTSSTLSIKDVQGLALFTQKDKTKQIAGEHTKFFNKRRLMDDKCAKGKQVIHSNENDGSSTERVAPQSMPSPPSDD